MPFGTGPLSGNNMNVITLSILLIRLLASCRGRRCDGIEEAVKTTRMRAVWPGFSRKKVTQRVREISQKSDAVSEGAPYTGNRRFVGRIMSVGLLYGHSNGPLGQYHRREV
ncbi:hypothetical protein EDD85DRAFT_789674 [Armillaria nabsnona]|nr:hypothetical protein EDD85DRAFT_789674 [Armillaria nabsnona]